MYLFSIIFSCFCFISIQSYCADEDLTNKACSKSVGTLEDDGNAELDPFSLDGISSFLFFCFIDESDELVQKSEEGVVFRFLQSTGNVIKTNPKTKEGIDMAVFSNPKLILKANPIRVDAKQPCSIFQVKLELVSTATFSRFKNIGTGVFWQQTCYLSMSEKKERFEEAVSKLFKSFLTDYRMVNKPESRPIFYTISCS